jgi:hypothetical protein
MLDIIIILGSFVLIATVIYFSINRLFDVIDPDYSSSRKYRIAVDNVVFLQQAKKYFDPKRCVLYTGQGSEILSEMKQTRVDLAVLEGNEGNPQESGTMKHIRASFRPSEPLSNDRSMPLFMLTDKARDLDIYYREDMSPVVQKLLGNRIITRIN